jgi:hypothetical protein
MTSRPREHWHVHHRAAHLDGDLGARLRPVDVTRGSKESSLPALAPADEMDASQRRVGVYFGCFRVEERTSSPSANPFTTGPESQPSASEVVMPGNRAIGGASPGGSDGDGGQSHRFGLCPSGVYREFADRRAEGAFHRPLRRSMMSFIWSISLCWLDTISPQRSTISRSWMDACWHIRIALEWCGIIERMN